MTIVNVGRITLQVERRAQRRTFVERLLAQIEAKVGYVVKRCIETALEAEVSLLLERERYERHSTHTGRRGAAQCQRCGSRELSMFQRNGHYVRHVDTGWGRLPIDMPQVECACNGAVQLPLQTLRPYQRFWDDLEAEMRGQYGQGLSLREVKANLDEQLHASTGLRTVNERVHQVAALVPGWREHPLAAVPPVVRLDGLWLTLMEATGKRKRDRLGRQRAVKRGHKRPILAAQGLWPKQGHSEIVAWVIGQAEDAASWLRLMEQMYQRGLSLENGLCLVVGDGSPGLEAARQRFYWRIPFQRCIFHKLRNLWQALSPPEDMDKKAARLYKRRLIRQAAQIWQAEDEELACWLQRDFSRQWQVEQPKAVATLERDFDLTLTFYQVQAAAIQQGQTWPAHLLRTTSPLEREFRSHRKRLRLASLFHSALGLQAVFHLLLIRQRTKLAALSPNQWKLVMERQLAAYY